MMITEQQAQALHDQRRTDDSEHDRCGCWCCCTDCDFDDSKIASEENWLQHWLPWLTEELSDSD